MLQQLPALLFGTHCARFCSLDCSRYFQFINKNILQLWCQVLGLFRVDEAHEIEGLDVVKHNEPAYPIGNDLEYV